MLVLGIILVIAIGFLAVNCISVKFTWSEKIGLAFPVGIGLQTMMMLIINLLKIKLITASVMLGGVLILLLLLSFLYKRRDGVIMYYKKAVRIDTSNCNLVWCFFIVLIAYFEYMNFTKCMYFPTFDRDSLAGFDTIGYVMAQEHTFRNLSIFQQSYMPHIHDAGSYMTYAPMVQLSYAFVYLLGAETSKLVPALMYLSLLIAFYGSMQRVTGPTGAAVATFFVLITPEMIAFSSLSATNVIHAATASSGIIYIALWLKCRERKDLYLGSLLLAVNIWTRSEGIVFIGAALAVVFADVLRNRHWKDLLPVAAALFPALLWAVFSWVSGFYAENIVIFRPYWDAEKAGIIWAFMKAYYKDTQFFGWTVMAFSLSLLANCWFLLKRKDNLALLAMVVISLAFYVMVLYQIDYKWDSIQNVLAYSAKRFFFCFIPMMWFYALSNHWARMLFGRLDSFLLLEEK